MYTFIFGTQLMSVSAILATAQNSNISNKFAENIPVYRCQLQGETKGDLAFSIFNKNNDDQAYRAIWPDGFAGEFEKAGAFMCTEGRGIVPKDEQPLQSQYELQWQCISLNNQSRSVLIWKQFGSPNPPSPFGNEFIELLDDNFKAVVSCR